jgi:hypothetical protein
MDGRNRLTEWGRNRTLEDEYQVERWDETRHNQAQEDKWEWEGGGWKVEGGTANPRANFGRGKNHGKNRLAYLCA